MKHGFTALALIISLGGARGGVTVSETGSEGYHGFRIPAVVTMKDGSLLAFCEARKNDLKDHGDAYGVKTADGKLGVLSENGAERPYDRISFSRLDVD